MAVRRRSVLKVPKIYAGGMADRNSRMEKGQFSLFFSYRLLNLFPFCVYAELSDSKRFDCVTVW